MANDFRSARIYMDAARKIKRLAGRKHSKVGELSTSYLLIGRRADEVGVCGDLPTFGPVQEARSKLVETQDVLAGKQHICNEAREALNSEAKTHTAAIAELEVQYKPLAKKQSAAADELSAARKAHADVESRLARTQSELSSLGPSAITGDPLDALQARLAQQKQSRDQIQTDLSAAQQAMQKATRDAKAAESLLTQSQKEWRSAESALQKGLAAAESLQSPDRDQKVAAAKENIERQTAENNRVLAEFQEKLNLARHIRQERINRFESVRAELAMGDEKVREIETFIKAKQLAGQLSQLESTCEKSQERLSQAGQLHDQAKAQADAKAAELAAAKEKWKAVKSSLESELFAAEKAQTQAQQTVETAQRPLEDAHRAFGQAIYESTARPQEIYAEFDRTQGLLAEIAEIDSDTTQQEIILDANRDGTKRMLIIGLSLTGVLLVLIVVLIILIASMSGGRESQNSTPATAPACRSLIQPAERETIAIIPATENFTDSVARRRKKFMEFQMRGLLILNVDPCGRML